MEKQTPETLREVLLKLQAADLQAIVVGGQAVNLWAYQYCERLPELEQHQPFASEDLDFFGGRVEAMLCQDVLGGELKLNRDFDPSPNAGVLLVRQGNEVLRIDILASVFGLNDAEVVGTALPFRGTGILEGIQIEVLHPILCLEGKLKCLRGLPQEGRQDLKHASMSVLFVREMLLSLCTDEDPRIGLKAVERVLNIALREDGLSAWYRHDVKVELAIPASHLEQISNEKWQRFSAIRYPQWLKQIQAKRDHYHSIMQRIKAKVGEERQESDSSCNPSLLPQSSPDLER